MLAATATLAALAAAVPNPCHDPALALRCPDLVMAPPSHLRVERSPSRRHVVLRMENRIVNIGAGPAELFGQRVSLSEMRARQVIADAAGRRRRIATGAELYFKSVPSRGGSYWKFTGRGALRAVGHRPRPGIARGWCAPGPSTTTACATSTACATGPTRPPRPLLRRVQPACATRARSTLGTSVGLGRRLPVDLSRQLDRRHRPAAAASPSCTAPTRATASSSPTRPTTSRSKIVRLPYKPGPQRCPKAQPVPPAPPVPTPPPPPPAPAPPPPTPPPTV